MHNATSAGKIDSIFKDEVKDSSALLIGRLMSAGLNPNMIERIARIPDIGDLALHYQSFHRGKISSDHVPRCASTTLKEWYMDQRRFAWLAFLCPQDTRLELAEQGVALGPPNRLAPNASQPSSLPADQSNH